MFRKLSTLVLFLLLGSPIVALAQNTGKLAGRVTDAADGEGLPGANVIIEGTTLGAATDLDGFYVILGVPVGSWDITARYIGYVDAQQTGVEINAGYTRTTNFDLQDDSILLDEIVVEEYRRPLIQNDAIGVPKVFTGEEISQLPVRGVTNVAAIQGGVVNSDGSDDLNIRGGREEEVAFYVDGVKVTGAIGVPQIAIAQQEILIGTIPPRYGDAQSGVISISTISGSRDFFGSAEFITSEAVDDYGYNLGSLAIGGPILPNGGASFFLSGSYTRQADNTPYSIPTLQLTDAAYADFQANPQSIQLVNGAGEQLYVALPGNIPDGTLVSDVLSDPASFGLEVPDGWEIATGATGDPILGFRTDFNTEDLGLFQAVDGKNNPLRDFTINGNMNFAPIRNLNVRVGGAYTDVREENYAYSRSWYNRDSNTIDEDRTARGYLTLRQNISNTAFYQLQVEYTKRDGVDYPERFSENIEDILFYGDVDHEANAVGATYFNVSANSDMDRIFSQRFEDGDISPGRVGGESFRNPGFTQGTYSKYDISQLRFSGSATTQYGVHQLEFGGEYEQSTRRHWSTGSVFSTNIAEFFLDCTPNAANDGCVPGTGTVERGFENAITRWEDVDFEDAGFLGVNGPTYYGYSFTGTADVDESASIGDYLDGTSRNIAPYEPIYYGGYLRDKIEFQDLVLDLGVRIDVFDNNTLVLRDRFALRDIYRVGDFGGGSQIMENGELVASLDGALPGTVDGDFAIYVGDGNEVVGYRDLEGRFYDTSGQRVLSLEITRDAGGAAIGRNVDGVLNDRVLEDFDPVLTVMPRIGVTFPVTDRALFFASYNVTSQRPSEANLTGTPRALATIQDYLVATSGQTRLNNSNLQPEVTTQYELGFRQRLGERAAVTISGFFRTQDNKTTLRNVDDAFPAGYSTYLSEDFTTTKGAEFEFELRRTNNVAVRANYTLSFASGTGSDAATARILSWRSQSGIFPETLSPLDFDQRHTVNASIDYRLGEGEGPELFGGRPLAGFGLNLLGSFGSGLPYSQLNAAASDPILESTNGQIEGEVNSVYNDWTGRLDFKIDRSFNLGPANLKAYVWVQNLLDTDNIYGVYRTTGLPDDDGYLVGEQGTADLSALTNLDERAAYEFAYSNFVGGPIIQNTFKVGGAQLYGLPRRIRLGILMDF